MSNLNHKHILKFYDIIDDDESEKIYLVMPVADYGECLQWNKSDMTFSPNHKFLSRNNAKKYKNLPKQTRFYSENYIREFAFKMLDAL